MKKIEDLSLEDISKGKVFIYIKENSLEVDEYIKHENKIKENTGYYLITGEAKLSDSSRYPAIFGISSDDGGEMFEYHFLINKKSWVSDKDDLFMILNKKQKEIFPFEYHLNVPVEGDLHTDFQY